jgi:Domain of unknown function (DUF4476)
MLFSGIKIMSKFISVLVLAASFAVPCQGQFASDRQNEKTKPGTPDPNSQMLSDLREARELVKRMPASGNRDRLELLLTRTESQLKQALGRLSDVMVKPTPISIQDFNRLSVSMRNQAFDKDKYLFLENVVAGHHFTCDQASQLLKHFSFDNDRIKGALALYPCLVDPENFNRVLEAFTFENNRKTVMERIKGR